jgi:hypothetical protein
MDKLRQGGRDRSANLRFSGDMTTQHAAKLRSMQQKVPAPARIRQLSDTAYR